MNESFNLSVIYKGEEQEFKARFERWGPAFRFAVLIGENTVTFEPDEEGNFRALGDGKVDVELLRLLVEKLEEINRASA